MCVFEVVSADRKRERRKRERELKGCAWKHGILHGFPIGKCEVASRKSTLPPFV